MSYRRIKYPSGRLSRPQPGINVNTSPPNTINMVGILSDVFATDGEAPPAGTRYRDKSVNPEFKDHVLDLSEFNDDERYIY